MIEYILAYFAVVLTSTAQVILKIGANKNKPIISLYSLIAYPLFVITTVINLYVYMKLPLKVAVFILPTNYLLIALISHFILKEKFTRTKLFGILFIFLGIICFNI